MISIDDLLARQLLPDVAIRFGIRNLLAKKLRDETKSSAEEQGEALASFIADLKRSPIAVKTAAANEQHYEVPTDFFKLVLGPRMKYSSGYWPREDTTFEESEEAMLALTCDRAELRDGLDVLELGCGWGSLTLWMAEKYPASRITGVSNSATQKAHIDAEAARRGLGNVRILTVDMNVFEAGDAAFDRVVSVEMFEHMKNYQLLMAKVARWLRPGGKLFVHIFTHREFAYHFEGSDPSAMKFGGGEAGSAKAWKDIWGSGQGIGAVTVIEPVAARVARLTQEYRDASAALAADSAPFLK